MIILFHVRGLDNDNNDDNDDHHDKDDDDNSNGRKGRGGDDKFGDDDNTHQIAKWEHEIKSLRTNLASDLVILQRMVHSPNRKNPYNKFDKWLGWKKNEVDQKVAELNVKIHKMKESLAVKESPCKCKAMKGKNVVANDSPACKHKVAK